MKNKIQILTAILIMTILMCSCAGNKHQMGCPYGAEETKVKSHPANSFHKISKDITAEKIG